MKKVTLRPPAPDDAAELYAAVLESVHELRPFMPWCHPGYSIEDSRRWIESAIKGFEAKSSFEFAILFEGAIAGVCGINQIDPFNRRANLGYWVRSGAAGKGVATEGVAEAVRWAFRETDLIRLEIVASIRNPASRRVAEKAGALLEGIASSRLMLHGDPHDAAIYSFVRDGEKAR